MPLWSARFVVICQFFSPSFFNYNNSCVLFFHSSIPSSICKVNEIVFSIVFSLLGEVQNLRSLIELCADLRSFRSEVRGVTHRLMFSKWLEFEFKLFSSGSSGERSSWNNRCYLWSCWWLCIIHWFIELSIQFIIIGIDNLLWVLKTHILVIIRRLKVWLLFQSLNS